MSTRFVLIDRDTPMLIRVDLRFWVTEGHLVHFILDAVAVLLLRGFTGNVRRIGHAQYSPARMHSAC